MNRNKIIVFRLLAALVPVLMFAMIEAALRFADVLPSRDLFIPFNTNSETRFLQVNPRIAERYFPGDGLVPTPLPETLLLKDKPENLYRVFVMGDSIVTGWPFMPHLAFSRILEQRLADAMPGVPVEVVNLGVAAFNSYSLLDMLDEVLDQQPDVILVYTGHNEYYGALGAASTATLGHSRWSVNLNLQLQRLDTVRLIKEAVAAVRKQIGDGSETDKKARTLMGQVVGDKAILLGDDVYEQGKRQFEDNLNAILGKAGDAGVPVVIGDLVMNLRDTRPFVSSETTGGESADQAYATAQRLEAQGKFSEARQAYTRSKDLDALRFRAPSEFDDIIRDAARTNDAHLVSLQEYFYRASPDGIPGDNLFLEHLHPTVEGVFLMSEAFFDGLLENGLLKQDWLAIELLPKTHYRESWPVTELDLALTKIRIIGLKDHWPFIPEGESTNATRNYEPATKTEELAKAIAQNRITYEQAQYALAEHFISKGQFAPAIRAYEALAIIHPLDTGTLNNAILKLIAARQFEAAIPFLQKSLRLEDSFFANKWLGQALIQIGHVDEGLRFLEKAKKIDRTDAQLLSNLTRAYIMVGNKGLAEATLEELEALSPNHPELKALRSSL